MSVQEKGRNIVVKYKRFTENACKFSLSNDAMTVLVQPTKNLTSERENYFYKGDQKIYIEMEEGIGANIITDLKGYFSIGSLIPAGYRGLLYLSLVKMEWGITPNSTSSVHESIFSIIPFSIKPPYLITKISLIDLSLSDYGDS